MTWRCDAVFGFSKVDFPPTGPYLKSFVKIRDVGKIAFWHPGRTYVRTHHHVFGHITMAAAPTALCRVLKLFIFVGNYYCPPTGRSPRHGDHPLRRPSKRTNVTPPYHSFLPCLSSQPLLLLLCMLINLERRGK